MLTNFQISQLCDIQIQWLPTPGHQKMSNLRVPKDASTSNIGLRFSDARCDVLDASGNAIGGLNNKTHLALSKLPSLNRIHFSGYIQQNDQDYPSSVTVSTRKRQISSAEFLVFGPKVIADDLAKELSRSHLFLQHPSPLPSEVPYENPQYLDIARGIFSNGSLLPPIQGLDNPETSCDASSQEDREQHVTDIIQALDDLPRHNYLIEANVDQRVSTTLLSHQKEGVDFILRREGPVGLNPRCLWKLAGLPQDVKIYHHLITGSTSDKPEDAPGGILADAMGVGKTLTMIAAIASSLKEAGEFASRQGTGSLFRTCQNYSVPATLILVPSALILDEWVSEIEKHVVPRTLQFYKYHGANRSLPLASKMAYHIVMSTYGTVAADFRRGGGVLYRFKWYRLVLDEAHFIRNWSTKQFKAVAELDAVIRWCMTGTPIQNSLEDLASLVRFLRVPIFEDASAFRRHIIGRKKTASGIAKPEFDKLRLLLGSICLRRSTSVLSLLGATFTTCRPSFSPEERDAYGGLALACIKSIDEAVSCQNTQKTSQKPILETLLKMRIFCNLGLGMEVYNNEPLTRLDERISLLQQSEALCAYCKLSCDVLDSQEAFHMTQDNSLICPECLPQFHPEIRERAVTDSRRRYANNTVASTKQSASTSNEIVQESPISWQSSSKLNALLKNIKEQDPGEKSVVFSFWIRSLDAVARLLTAHNINFRQIDGSLPDTQRKQMLSEFLDPSVQVLLMTLGTGAVGLNQLSVASYLHLLEPQWNPAVENQAIGRLIRLDQQKQVTITRYVTKSTIEESVENRQALKLRLAIAGGLQSSSSQYMERIDSLRELAKAIQTQLNS
ncbi:SNF2 family N-terminal domain-containing protein [Hypoxylon crocopeplum]|nr:SNF2 family N-terminal domain-containing protein [Hypoxylon crocopeplum]